MSQSGSQKWAIVTGASSGLGEVFAKDLVKRGYSVLAVARRLDRLEALAKSSGGKIEALQADLGTPEGLDAVVARAGQIGSIELLVNNAGFANYGKFLESTPDKERAQIRLNIEGLVNLIQRLLPAMVKRGRGGVINVASALGTSAVPFYASYAATKAFVLNFSLALGYELEGTGVKVHVICPGPMKTEFYTVSKSENILKGAPLVAPEAVVAMAIDSWESGKAMAIPGFPIKMLAFLSRIVPRTVMRGIWGGMFKPKP